MSEFTRQFIRTVDKKNQKNSAHNKGSIEKYFDIFYGPGLIPAETPELILDIDNEKETLESIIPELIDMRFAESRYNLLEMIDAGNVRIDNEIITADDLEHILVNEEILMLGRDKYLRIVK